MKNKGKNQIKKMKMKMKMMKIKENKTKEKFVKEYKYMEIQRKSLNYLQTQNDLEELNKPLSKLG